MRQHFDAVEFMCAQLYLEEHPNIVWLMQSHAGNRTDGVHTVGLFESTKGKFYENNTLKKIYL